MDTTRTAQNNAVRNIAIIAHVDHGKTTLVDSMFKQSGMFSQHEDLAERVMDSGDLERERGITISAKNCEVIWDGVRINILDTPGHADFGGEVERALSMVDGVVLLVDAAEGPLPQTRFVLQKALALKLEIIILINKIDRQDARPEEVYQEVLELLIDLGADDTHLESPVIFADGRSGIAMRTLGETSQSLQPLMETILSHIPGPSYDEQAPFQLLVSDLDYSDYLGRMAIGRVFNGSVTVRDRLVCVGKDNQPRPLKVSKLQIYQGLKLAPVDSVEAGDIAILSGADELSIGDTICTAEAPKALPRLTVDEPTVSMMFLPNNSPLVGKEGKYVQSSRIYDRLHKEALRNVALRIETSGEGDGFIVKGRGEFQLAIIIETMRREGYEFCVGRPQVIFKQDERGKKTEPIEHLIADIEEQFSSIVTETLLQRRAVLLNVTNHHTGRVHLEFSVPSRALIGYRDTFLTDTKGTGIMNAYVEGYEAYRGDFPARKTGSLVSDRPGNAVAYGLFGLEARGRLFVVPGDPVYEGMIVGEHNRENDLDVNPTRTKQLSNMRAAGKDNNIVLTPVTPLTPESALNMIKDDELVEITPKSVRLRKYTLTKAKRKLENR
ncbi:MAG: translational GTPase TypA [Spirochaetota bacterium]